MPHTYLQAQLYGLTGQVRKAAKVFQCVIDEKPDRAMAVFSALHIAAQFEADKKPFEARLQRFLRLKRYRPYYVDLYYGLGALEEKAEDTTAARAAYRQAVKSKAFYQKSKGLSYARLMDFAFGENRFSRSY